LVADVYGLDRIVSQSSRMRPVLERARAASRSETPVLITGETGTGKELVARAIHDRSAQRTRPLVKVNCAAIPETLLESELFGHVRGAFTGAVATHLGKFQAANGGTIFLDEVGELPPEVQVKLLRVLQAGEFERLGSPKTTKVNVRIIAATNRDLAEEVRKGRFREDLFYRLNVFPIRMPALRERTEDIPLLVWTFLAEFSSRMGKKVTQVPRRTMEALVRHPWPGNIRELRNVIENGVIVSSGETLRVPLLGGGESAAPSSQTLADVEREHIRRTLEATGWRVKGPRGAAVAHGINPATLYGRMKKLGIQPRRSQVDPQPRTE
jgi:transcriptional regulator with GAF, ATPase, and Fis domain